MSTAVSPLAPTSVPDMPEIAGVRLATAAAGIRYKGRTDVMLALLAVYMTFFRRAPMGDTRGDFVGGLLYAN